jgi:hypothetical protein
MWHTKQRAMFCPMCSGLVVTGGSVMFWLLLLCVVCWSPYRAGLVAASALARWVAPFGFGISWLRRMCVRLVLRGVCFPNLAATSIHACA